VRFRNNNTLDGVYKVTLGADDGIALAIKTPADLISPSTPAGVHSFALPGMDLSLIIPTGLAPVPPLPLTG